MLKSFETQNFTFKKIENNLALKKKNATSLLKEHNKNLSVNKIVGRPRGRPRKEVNTNMKTQKHQKLCLVEKQSQQILNKVVKESQKTKEKRKPTSKSKPWNATPVSNKKKRDHGLVVETILPKLGKHKIGPKLVTKKDNSSKSCDEDEEYTDIETLEDIDYNMDDNLNWDELGKNVNNLSSTPSSQNPTLTYIGSINDDDNINVNLSTIHTDESEDCTPMLCEDCKSKRKKVGSSITTDKSKITSQFQETLIELKTNKTSKVKTIYDLMIEVSLQRPSWNLHVLPEANKFYIAQITIGQLKAPVMNKYIELDSENYNAKVYIHYFHIKRFDGIYDNEESILALIEEVDSIEAHKVLVFC